jgi:glycosyltransferase involved in cell wall biosynthesis
VLEVPGFGRRVGAPLYVALALALGLARGRRGSFLAMQLGSQALVAGICARLLRRPLVVLSTTGGEISEVEEALASRGRFLHRAGLRRADFLVGQTAAAARELEAFAPPERIAVVHNPMPPAPDAGLDGRPRAVYTGRLARKKNLELLLEAWEEVVARLPGARLTLVGDGGDYEPVEERLRATVASRPALHETVAFSGWVDDVGPYLQGADVYVFPSLSEGLSNSLLEACAWGRVAVASDIAPNRAVLGDDYPLLFPAENRGLLVERLLAAFADPDLRAAATAAIERRRAALSGDAAIARYEELLLAAGAGRDS